ncbi:MAG: TetR/AcrR family transcriptional regulator [Calditrichaeota bacterium]|nr:TetR/AcrR family transcriptional regulator [Calditrichota bacterium]
MKEKEIILAARKRFAYYGFSKVTMDEIAADIGMAKASLYYYFPTKVDLFIAVVTEEQDQFIEKINCILQAKTSATDKLQQYVSERLGHFETFINLAKLSFQAIQELKPLFADLHKNFSEREHELLAGIIRDGMNNGEFKPGEPEKTATLILHVLHGLRIRRYAFIKDFHFDDTLHQQIRDEMLQVLDMLLDGLRAD